MPFPYGGNPRHGRCSRQLPALLFLLAGLCFAVLCARRGYGLQQDAVVALTWQRMRPPTAAPHLLAAARSWSYGQPIRLRQPVQPAGASVSDNARNAGRSMMKAAENAARKAARKYAKAAEKAVEKSANKAAKRLIKTAKKNPGTAAGVVLGGILAGPWGAAGGAWLGSTFDPGTRRESKRSSTGLDKNTLKSAQQCARELARAEQSLELLQATHESQRKTLAYLEQAMSASYAAAETAMMNSDEAAARHHLEEHVLLKPQLMEVKVELAGTAERKETMESRVAALAERYNDLEQTISRSEAVRKALSSEGSFAGDDNDDPVLSQFRQLELGSRDLPPDHDDVVSRKFQQLEEETRQRRFRKTVESERYPPS
eukprot:gnl/TRDRNA2_/TRDRNA2_36857_c0_seq1.p1 gnl/TRDRNA2_/TRDRNA2_36857_c0~~gnl/TRDRNA2_/TRDRNA2_36857_c0_seq1.p1  ORF type:complete len:372 (+),score=77.13 gnl/TRDRNA2_/TRDRNA2_36857_c0_seq1:39-1154(+)